MASARMERAELPVHRKSTLKVLSVIVVLVVGSAGVGRLLGRTAWSQFLDQWCAEFGVAAAAVLDQVKGHLTEALEVGAVDDGAALTLAGNQASIGQDRKVRRHRVLRNADQTRQIACGNAH